MLPSVCGSSYATKARGRLLQCRSPLHIYVLRVAPPRRETQDMLVHGSESARFVCGMGASPRKSCVRQRTDLSSAAKDTPAMPQFSIPNSPSRETFLSPRKSLLAVGVVCALSAVALWTGRMPAPTPALDAENPTELHANPDLDSPAPTEEKAS